ncbi:hypothetical protein MBLNU230_g3450t1 [Neophaeotheca triangularis]
MDERSIEEILAARAELNELEAHGRAEGHTAEEIAAARANFEEMNIRSRTAEARMRTERTETQRIRAAYAEHDEPQTPAELLNNTMRTTLSLLQGAATTAQSRRHILRGHNQHLLQGVRTFTTGPRRSNHSRALLSSFRDLGCALEGLVDAVGAHPALRQGERRQGTRRRRRCPLSPADEIRLEEEAEDRAEEMERLGLVVLGQLSPQGREDLAELLAGMGNGIETAELRGLLERDEEVFIVGGRLG